MCYPESTIILQNDIKFFIYKFVYVIQKVLLFYRAILSSLFTNLLSRKYYFILQSDIKFFIYKFVYVIQKVLLFYRVLLSSLFTNLYMLSRKYYYFTE